MRLDHIERFNKATAGYRLEVEAYIRECESELKRAHAIAGTIRIAEALVVPEMVDIPHVDSRVTKPGPTNVDRVLDRLHETKGRPKVVELNKTELDRLEREISASIDEVLTAG